MAGYVNQPSTSNACARSRKTMLFVLANGRTQEMPCKVVLTEPDIKSWDLILDLIARNLDFPTGVQYLYTVAGDAIRNPRSLQNANVYVAVPKNEEFVHLDYIKVFRSLLPMREVDLKRIDISAEHPQQVNDPVVVTVAQSAGYNIVGKSKSDGLATINNTGNYNNLYCCQNKKRPTEMSQPHGTPAPDTRKQIQASTKPCGDVQDSSPSEPKAKTRTSDTTDNDKIKEEMEHLTDLQNQPIEISECIQTWLLEVIYSALSEADDEVAEDAVNDDGLVFNHDTSSDDGYVTSDEKDATGDQYETEQEAYADFDDCIKLCMLKLGEEPSTNPETISTKTSSDSSQNTASDISNSSDKASVDLEFYDDMSVRIGSKDLVIAVTVEEPKSLDEENSTENSTTPVSAGSSSEKLDSSEASNHEMNNAINYQKSQKKDQHSLREDSVGPCKIPNCPRNRVPQKLTVYQTSFGRDRTSSTTNRGQPPGVCHGTSAVANTNRTLQGIQSRNYNPNSANINVGGKTNARSCMGNPKNVSQGSETIPRCSNLVNNGVKLVNNNKNMPPPPKRNNSPRTSLQEGNRKDTKKSLVKENANRFIERNQKQCYPKDCPFGREKLIENGPLEKKCPQVAQMQGYRRPNKGAGKKILINQNDAAYNSYSSNRDEPNTFCSPVDCPLKINGHEIPNVTEQDGGTSGVPRAASVVENPQIYAPVDKVILNKRSTLTNRTKFCSIKDYPLKSNEQKKSNDLTIDKYNTSTTPPNSLDTTKDSPASIATETSGKQDDKCEEVCVPCPYKDRENKGTRRSKPQSVSMPSKNEETKIKAVKGSVPSARDSKLPSTCVKNAHTNNKISAPGSSSPKNNIPVRRVSLNDNKMSVPPTKANCSKSFKPQTHITTSKARSDQSKVKAGLCKTCPPKAAAESKMMSASPSRNPSLHPKRNYVTESPKSNNLKPNQVKVEPKENKPYPTKVMQSMRDEHSLESDEPNNKYCYPYNCNLKDKKVETYCEPISCQGECESEKDNRSVTKEPELNNKEVGTTYQERTRVPESSIIAEYRNEIYSEQAEDNKKYSYRETCPDRKPEKYSEPVSYQDECQNVGMQTSEIKTDSEPTSLKYKERKVQLPIQNMKCMPITCNDMDMSCLKEKEVTAYRKSEGQSVPLARNFGVEAEMLESAPTQLRRSIPENEPVEFGRCIKSAEQHLSEMPTQVHTCFKMQQNEEHQESIAKAEAIPIENVTPTSKKPDNSVKTRQHSTPHDDSIFVQCAFKTKPAKQNLDEKHVRIACPFKTRQNQEITLKQDVNIPTVETGTNPIPEVVPVTESAVVQADIVRESSTQYQDKEETQGNKAAKYCYIDTCHFKDRKKPNKIELRNTNQSDPPDFQADSGNETAEDYEETHPVAGKCNDCIPSEESKDDKQQLYPVDELNPNYTQPIEHFEKNCYLDSCQVDTGSAEDENGLPISRTKCNVCGVVKIVESKGASETETERKENENMGPDNGTFNIKDMVMNQISKMTESLQFFRNADSPMAPLSNNENNEDDLQPNWHNFSEELEEYSYSDFPDWRKTCCLTDDCPIHLFKKSFTRNGMPPTIDEVDEEILLDDLSGSKVSSPESEKESNLEPFEDKLVNNTNERTSGEEGITSIKNVVNERMSDIKGFHCPKCHVELLIINDDSKNMNAEKEAGPGRNIPVCETFLAKQNVSDLPTTPVSENPIQEENPEDKVDEPPVPCIQQEVPTEPERGSKSLSKTSEHTRIIFAPEIGAFVSEAESRAASGSEHSLLRSTASIQEKIGERKEVEQTPSQFITDIIKSSKVVIDKFKLKPRGLTSLGIKQPKCPDHVKQPGQQEPCCKCPDDVTRTNENKEKEKLACADDYDLLIFTEFVDEETPRQIPSVGTKETKETLQTQPCVTTIEHLESGSRIYVPRFVTTVNFTQTYVETPLKEERQGVPHKNDSLKSSLSSPMSFSQAAKRKVSIKQDNMSQPMATRYSVQEQPSPDMSERESNRDSGIPSKDEQNPLGIVTGLLASEPISLTTSTTTLHIVKSLVKRKTENCVPASLKEENQSKRLSENTLESRASRLTKCYCKEKTCVCNFECLGRRLNAIRDEVSAGGPKKSTKSHKEGGRKSGLSTPSIVTPCSLSGLIVGENSSEFNGPAATYSKSLTVSPMTSGLEQKESLLQLSPDKQKQSFESVSSIPVVTDNKNKIE